MRVCVYEKWSFATRYECTVQVGCGGDGAFFFLRLLLLCFLLSASCGAFYFYFCHTGFAPPRCVLLFSHRRPSVGVAADDDDDDATTPACSPFRRPPKPPNVCYMCIDVRTHWTLVSFFLS